MARARQDRRERELATHTNVTTHVSQSARDPPSRECALSAKVEICVNGRPSERPTTVSDVHFVSDSQLGRFKCPMFGLWTVQTYSRVSCGFTEHSRSSSPDTVSPTLKHQRNCKSRPVVGRPSQRARTRLRESIRTFYIFAFFCDLAHLGPNTARLRPSTARPRSRRRIQTTFCPSASLSLSLENASRAARAPPQSVMSRCGHAGPSTARRRRSTARRRSTRPCRPHARPRAFRDVAAPQSAVGATFFCAHLCAAQARKELHTPPLTTEDAHAPLVVSLHTSPSTPRPGRRTTPRSRSSWENPRPGRTAAFNLFLLKLIVISFSKRLRLKTWTYFYFTRPNSFGILKGILHMQNFKQPFWRRKTSCVWKMNTLLLTCS